MGKALIIGCGGVASVAIHKCCQNSDEFSEILIASRTKSKCDALKEKLEGTTKTKIRTAQVDADDVEALIALIEDFQPDVVLNLALPYQDLHIMDACLATKTNYVDTANYEPEDTAKFEYKWQWAYRERYEKAGITALLGSGFDPGVTGVFAAYALKHRSFMILAAYALAGLVIALIALLLYRTRKSEMTGSTVAFPWATPIFKYGVAFCTAVALGQFLYYFLFGQYR